MGWTFFWLMVVLKIPIIGLFSIVYWAIKQTDEPVEDAGDGGSKTPAHPPSRTPPHPRKRGPHGDPALPAPKRSRMPLRARGRELQR